MDHDREIDALGLMCPLPVLKTRKTLQAMAPGAVLRVLADDPVAAVDIPHFCAEAGHELLKEEAAAGGGRLFYIRKRG